MELLASLLTSLAGGSIAGYLTFVLKATELQKKWQFQDNAERVVLGLLSREEWTLRSFKVIQHHLGGFTETELRKLLVRAGAIRFKSKSGLEIWGLLSRNEHLLGFARIDEDPANTNDMDSRGDLFNSERADRVDG